MPQPTQAPSPLPADAGIKAGKSGGSVSPSASRPSIIAVEGEGGFTYFHRMMAQGGPAGTGKTHIYVPSSRPQPTLPKPHTPVNELPIRPSPASEAQKDVSIEFAIRVVEYYLGHQGQFPATTNAPATEVVVPGEITQIS